VSVSAISNFPQYDPSPSGGFVARSVAEIERIRPELNELPFGRLDPAPDYFLTVVRERDEVVRPHVYFGNRGDGARVALVGRMEDTVLETRAGYRAIYRPRVRSLVLAHGGLSGHDTPEGAAMILRHLRGVLAAGEAEVALLPSLPVESELFREASALRFPARQASIDVSRHWALRLPDSFDEFVRTRSKSTRDNIKRYRNRLHRDFGDGVRLERYMTVDSADILFRDARRVAEQTYQHGLGVAFADSRLDRELTCLGLARGWARVYVLYLDGQPAAFWPGAVWGGTFFSGTPGYDTRFADYGIGKYVLMRLIQDLCEEPGIDSVDYGSGEADYKRQFGNDNWAEADVLLFSSRPRAVRINLTRSLLGGGVGGAKRLVERLGLASTLRRRLRTRAAARSSTASTGRASR
jgi:hypothetical protein